MGPTECSAALAATLPGRRFGEPQPILGGWSFWTFAVDDLIVRFPVSDEDAAGLEREFRLLPELSRVLPVAVPRYTLRGEWGGRPFGAYPRIPGLALDDPTQVTSLPAAVFTELARTLASLHSFPVEAADQLVGSERAEDDAFWEAVRRDALPLVPESLRALAQAPIERHLVAGGSRLEALVHRDLGFVHLLSDGRRLTGIIDWTDACIADPAKDFVGLLANGGWDLVRAVIAEYGPVAEDFEARVGFYAWVAPLHDMIYGLTTGQPEHVVDGIRGLERRMRLAGVLC